ncbi:MAG: HD-GYP domain-containing protein [Solirubrobacterales bacterium]
MQSLGRGKDRARRIDTEHVALGKEARPPRVLRTFAVYTAIAFLIAAVAIALLVRNNIRANSGEKVAELTGFVAKTVIPERVPEGFWEGDLSEVKSLGVGATISRQTERSAARTVRFYDTDGKLLYSSNSLSDGNTAEPAMVKSALLGEKQSKVVRNSSVDSDTTNQLIEGFAPVYYPGRSQPAGVVELVVPYSAAAGSIRSQAGPLAIALLLVMFGLYLALWPLLRRTTNQLSFSYNELRRSADEMQDSLRERAEIEARLRDTIEELERSENALAHSQEETIMRLALAVESRDAETGRHIERMGKYCTLMASKLGWSAQSIELLRIASPLHDVGKIAISDNVLQKPGKLTPDERLVVERHAEIGHSILAGSESPLLDLAARIALTHHERWDGDGYPQGLAGEEIPIEGRLAAIADVFDALTSDRVYRKAMSIDQALSIMADGRGTHFDPDLLDVFFDSIVEVLMIRDGNELSNDSTQTANANAVRRRRNRKVGGSRPAPATSLDDDDQRHSMVG